VSRNVFQTAQFYLWLAQEACKEIVAKAKVDGVDAPVTVDCALTEDEKGFVVGINFRIPFPVADTASTDGERH
jgi:hypothetical protein